MIFKNYILFCFCCFILIIFIFVVIYIYLNFLINKKKSNILSILPKNYYNDLVEPIKPIINVKINDNIDKKKELYNSLKEKYSKIKKENENISNIINNDRKKTIENKKIIDNLFKKINEIKKQNLKNYMYNIF